ncbi:MAG: NADH-quinone oxidoreductase subunit D [Chloroflexi bacterium]|nr:NADH-quinone oxidoreductase subunit D [Chloroflexota bacterium]
MAVHPRLDYETHHEQEGTMIINMGPQHPSTHGVLRLVLELDGEEVVNCTPVIGYLHTGFEKEFETRNYLQNIVLTDRMDYLATMSNNLAYSLAVEKLFGVDIPPRGKVIRVMMAELSRIASHLVWLGTTALEIGAQSVFLYCFRERETILDIFERASGARMMTSYIRPGGLMMDIPEGALEQTRAFIDEFPARVAEYEDLLTENEIWRDRTVGIGYLDPKFAVEIGLTGPMIRAAGIDWDLRKTMPYAGYDEYDFQVPLRTESDCYARYLVRLEEMRESRKIVQQCLQRLPDGPVNSSNRKLVPPPRSELAVSMEALIHHFKIFTEGPKPPAGEIYQAVESPRGEIGFHIVSDGTAKPYKVHVRAPSFANLQSLSELAKGALVADLVAIIASLDPVLGDVDR